MFCLKDEVVEFDQAGEPIDGEDEDIDDEGTKISIDDGNSETGSDARPRRSILRPYTYVIKVVSFAWRGSWADKNVPTVGLLKFFK